MATVALQTVGCKLNQAESESLGRRFLEAGYRVVAPDAGADIYVLNTCTVTHIADRKCRHLIRLAHRRNPHSFIVVTGCYAERAPQELVQLEGVGLVVNNRDKESMLALLGSRLGAPKGERGLHHAPFRTRTLVKVQDGCSRQCSFCVVPRARGGERSRPLEEVVAEVQARVVEGHQEVVLTGTRIGAYGDDRHDLEALVEQLLCQTTVGRLRVTSLEPKDLTPSLLRLWRERRLCRHLHLPLQSGSNAVLRRMGRGYSLAEYERAATLAVETIPDLALTTDVMVGFPGEGEEEFEQSYRFCEAIGFAAIHVFPYSPRPGTRAAAMPGQVAEAEKKRRVQRMLELARESASRFRRRFLGTTVLVLGEQPRNGFWSGLSDNYLRVYVPSSESLADCWFWARLVAEHDAGLLGEIVSRRGGFRSTPLSMNGGLLSC